jgi:hypothetical protein
MSGSRETAVMAQSVDPWSEPVFGDIVHLRDFFEEKHIATDFRRVYPKRKTFRQFDGFFDVMEYPDRVFHAWIAKSEAERLAAFQRGFPGYERIMREIAQRVATPPAVEPPGAADPEDVGASD